MKKKVLDVTDQRCPLTFLKAKEFLRSNLHCEKKILIKGSDDFKKLKNSISRNFQIETKKRENSIYEIIVKKSKFSSPSK
jgi:TusA-related sulfurtransferase